MQDLLQTARHDHENTCATHELRARLGEAQPRRPDDGLSCLVHELLS